MRRADAKPGRRLRTRCAAREIPASSVVLEISSSGCVVGALHCCHGRAARRRFTRKIGGFAPAFHGVDPGAASDPRSRCAGRAGWPPDPVEPCRRRPETDGATAGSDPARRGRLVDDRPSGGNPVRAAAARQNCRGNDENVPRGHFRRCGSAKASLDRKRRWPSSDRRIVGVQRGAERAVMQRAGRSRAARRRLRCDRPGWRRSRPSTCGRVRIPEDPSDRAYTRPFHTRITRVSRSKPSIDTVPVSSAKCSPSSGASRSHVAAKTRSR